MAAEPSLTIAIEKRREAIQSVVVYRDACNRDGWLTKVKEVEGALSAPMEIAGAPEAAALPDW
jgi:hypothetical protein